MLIYGYGKVDGQDLWSDADEGRKIGWRILELDPPTSGRGFIQNTKNGLTQTHSFHLDYKKTFRVEQPEPEFNEWGEDAL